ncbi:MAG TPA: archaeosine synthase subunit alpha [Methanocorpusculum sp.]|nr:archaeosine synthase subunit alpha [Methanocorpusculum sp.]
MSLFDVRRRDFLARIGSLKIGDDVYQTPAVLDMEVKFPSLAAWDFSNLPLSAPKSDIDKYFTPGAEEPYCIHPLNTAGGPGIVMVTNWNNTLEDSKRTVEYLEMLQNAPVDSARYAPASALPSNVASLIYAGFDVFDYTAVDLASIQGKFCTVDGEFSKEYMNRGICCCEGCKTGDVKLHNRLALEREIAYCKTWIERGQMREFIEMRCRMKAPQVELLRHIDRSTAFDTSYPSVRAARLYANAGESMFRREIALFENRILERFTPPRSDICVLLPCAARKPYSLSRSHQMFMKVVDNRAHEVIVTSPLGVVPRELELIYPAGHYDVPVTGYWDKEECSVLAGYLAAYLSKFHYDRILCHLEGGAKEVAKEAAVRAGVTLEFTCNDDKPLSQDSLRALNNALRESRRVRSAHLSGTLSWQFGDTVETKGWIAKGRYPEQKIYEKKTQIFSIDTETGLLRPTHDGWKFISGYRVQISPGFTPQGDVLAPGVADCDPRIREGDEVLVEGEGYLATGKAAMGAYEMTHAKRGVAVKVRKTKKN